MQALFGKPKTTKEVVREQKRSIQHSQRDLDRELQVLDREEKKCVAEIKKLAKAGQNSSAKVLAKQLLRIRKQREKIYQSQGQLSAVSARTTTMQANETMAKSMNGATRAMMAVNQANPVAQVQKTMMMYEKQNEMANMKEEMMDDMFEATEEEEGEAEDTVNAVLDEIGLGINEQMSKATVGKEPLGTKAKQSAQDKELEQLLAQMP